MIKYFYIAESRDHQYRNYKFRSKNFDSSDECESECFSRFKETWKYGCKNISIRIYRYYEDMHCDSVSPVVSFQFTDYR